MENPKISLIIPAHNEEKNIVPCLIHAVQSSGGKFFEIIVINNASSDNTRQKAESVKGVRVVDEQKKGLTMARERGRLEARGDILAYIDADTIMPRDWYQRVSDHFKNENIGCVSGPYTYFDISSFQNSLVWMYWNILARVMYSLTGYMVVGGNFAIRKNVIEKMHGFDTNIVFYGEDTNIARRAHKFGKVLFDFKLVMPTSGRRFQGNGFLPTAWTYMVNFASEAFLHHPRTTEYKDIR